VFFYYYYYYFRNIVTKGSIHGGLIYYYGNAQSSFGFSLNRISNISCLSGECLGGTVYVDGSPDYTVGSLTVNQNIFEFIVSAKKGGALYVAATLFSLFRV
jgi:hypothetical protein